jgi:epoxide hydrolase-like predicted phosphatase
VPAITAVVFDYGGVITEPPYLGIERYEHELGLPHGALRDYFREGHDLFDQFVLGELDGRTFMKTLGTRVQDEHGHRLDLTALRAAMEVTVQPVMIDLVRALHGQVRLGILTNNVREASWREEVPIELFDVVVDSSAVALRKPDPRIYELMLAKLGRPAAEVAYFDDLTENLAPALELGIVAMRYVDAASCCEQLVALGLNLPARLL